MTKHLLKTCIWLRAKDYGDLWMNFLGKDAEGIVQTAGKAAQMGATKSKLRSS